MVPDTCVTPCISVHGTVATSRDNPEAMDHYTYAGAREHTIAIAQHVHLNTPKPENTPITKRTLWTSEKSPPEIGWNGELNTT